MEIDVSSAVDFAGAGARAVPVEDGPPRTLRDSADKNLLSMRFTSLNIVGRIGKVVVSPKK